MTPKIAYDLNSHGPPRLRGDVLEFDHWKNLDPEESVRREQARHVCQDVSPFHQHR